MIVCKTSDIAVGKGRMVTVGEKEIALFNVNGTFYAIDNECAHLGGPLADGFLKECRVTCPWHNWEYDVRTGKETLQGRDSVASYIVRVEGDDIHVEL